MTLLIISVGLALGVSALCSLLEATLLSLPPSHVSAMRKSHPHAAAVWETFKNIEKPIAAILVVNTAAHTIGASMAGAQFEILYGERWLLLFSLVFTYLMLQFTEILPKTLGVHYNRSLAPRIAHPLNGLVRLFTPVLRFVHFVNRPFEGRRAESDTTLEDIAALASIARISRLIDSKQEKIIRVASRLDEMSVRQIMTPRSEVMFLRLDQQAEEILNTVQNSPYTRLPLCEKDMDAILGMVHVKDLFKQLDLHIGRFGVSGTGVEQSASRQSAVGGLEGEIHILHAGSIDLMKIRRDILYLPEQLPVIQALRQLQESRTHLAAVVNEYGATLGVITMEDIIEEMVGEIEDEFDLDTPPLFVPEGKIYRVSGRLPLHELQGHVPEMAVDVSDVNTVGGYVVKVLGRIPVVGDEIIWGSYHATVTRVDNRRVHEIILVPRPDSGEDR